MSYKLLSTKQKQYIRFRLKLLWEAVSGRLRTRLRASREYQLLINGGLFDAAFYREQNPDVISNNYLEHYLEFGAAEGRDPNLLFSTRWYLEQNKDVATAGTNPLAHFAESGWLEGRNPHPLFDGRYYLHVNQDVAESKQNPLCHYLSAGYKEARNPHPLFDAASYFRQNPDIESTTQDALSHYLLVGWREGHNPHFLFDTTYYLEQNPDVVKSGQNPLLHFAVAGFKESRNPSPIFDISYYVGQNTNLRQSGANPLVHYLTATETPLPNPHPLFDNQRYLEQNPDVAASRQNALMHYLVTGFRERRSPHALFDTDYYLDNNLDLSPDTNPLVHFVRSGFQENRNPNALFDIGYYAHLYPDVGHPKQNVLVHYAMAGGRELRTTHPLFDPHYYKSQIKGEMTGTPLAHYLDHGIRQRLSPHALFDVNFYLTQHPDLSRVIIDPVRHYLDVGAKAKSDPCELFDTSFYVERYPEVRQSGVNPLIHYVLEGADCGFDPNPFFDGMHYLREYPDVVAKGQNALVHYMSSGASEGRTTSLFFNSLFYLIQNPQVRQWNINPLVHYLARGGAEEPRDASPFFSASDYLRDHPAVADLKLNPLLHYLERDAPQIFPKAESDTSPSKSRHVLRTRSLNLSGGIGPTSPIGSVICLTHVTPLAPRAGNEYRLNRLLSWLQASGYEVIPVISSLGVNDVTGSQVSGLTNVFGSALLCKRDGEILGSLGEKDYCLLQNLHGSSIPAYAEILAEAPESLGPGKHDLVATERVFCHDTLMTVVLELASRRKSCLVLAEYIFMSRVLPLLGPDTFKVIDTHDVFSSKGRKVLAYGVADSLNVSEPQEAKCLSRADLILAIQPEEQRELERVVGASRKVITVGVDFAPSYNENLPDRNKIVFVGSDNAMNVRGMRDFLRFAWPFVLERVPDAELIIAGRVCESVTPGHFAVSLLGEVSDTDRLYQQAKVAINPALAGTGLKIKTLESLSFFRPLVTWPTGVDGLHPDLAALCSIAADWFDFHQKLADILTDSKAQWFTEQQRNTIEDHLSTSKAYASLNEELVAFQHRQPF